MLRSLGVEFPVAGDPVKVHGLIREDNASFWRVECLACDIRSKGFASPSLARGAARSHATAISHSRNVRRAALSRQER